MPVLAPVPWPEQARVIVAPARLHADRLDRVKTVIRSQFRSLEEWGEWINANAQPSNADGNRTVLAGSGGRPASREELVAFVAEQNARHAREHPHE